MGGTDTIDCSPAGEIRISAFPSFAVSTDGRTWQPSSRTRTSTPARAMRFIDSAHGWMAGTAPESWHFAFAVARTSDPGETWTLHLVDRSPGAGGLTGIDFADPLHGVTVSGKLTPPRTWGFPDAGTAFHTRDGGGSWLPSQLPAGIGPLTEVEIVR